MVRDLTFSVDEYRRRLLLVQALMAARRWTALFSMNRR